MKALNAYVETFGTIFANGRPGRPGRYPIDCTPVRTCRPAPCNLPRPVLGVSTCGEGNRVYGTSINNIPHNCGGGCGSCGCGRSSCSGCGRCRRSCRSCQGCGSSSCSCRSMPLCGTSWNTSWNTACCPRPLPTCGPCFDGVTQLHCNHRGCRTVGYSSFSAGCFNPCSSCAWRQSCCQPFCSPTCALPCQPMCLPACTPRRTLVYRPLPPTMAAYGENAQQDWNQWDYNEVQGELIE